MANTPKPHWTQTSEGRAKMKRAQKKAWKKRRASAAKDKAKLIGPADRTIRQAIARGDHKKANADRRPKHIVRVYTHEDGQTVRSRFTARSWGELFDAILENERNGVLIEEIYVEANV